MRKSQRAKDERIKVLIDGSVYLFAPRGGAFNYLNELIGGLMRLQKSDVDFDLELLAPADAHAAPNGGGLKLRRSLIPSLRWLPLGRTRQRLGKIRRQLENKLWNFRVRGNQKTVFHSVGYAPFPSKGVPQVFSIHDMTHEKFPDMFPRENTEANIRAKTRCIQKATRLIAISECTKKDLIEIAGISPDRIDVVHHGVNFEVFHARKSKADETFIEQLGVTKPYLLFVGGRLNHKNFSRFIEAYAESRFVKTHPLVVAGTKWEAQEQVLIEKLKIEKQVILVKAPTDEDLSKLYRGAVTLVYPSLYEGFGMPILEAMACGTPVAASNTGPMPEVGGDAAVYFNPLDKKAILDAIEELCDPKIASLKIKVGLERVKGFSWDETARKTLESYRKTILASET